MIEPIDRQILLQLLKVQEQIVERLDQLEKHKSAGPARQPKAARKGSHGSQPERVKSHFNRAHKEELYAPPLTDQEVDRLEQLVEWDRTYTLGDLARKFGGDRDKAKRVAYWLQRRKFWTYQKQDRGYLRI